MKTPEEWCDTENKQVWLEPDFIRSVQSDARADLEAENKRLRIEVARRAGGGLDDALELRRLEEENRALNEQVNALIGRCKELAAEIMPVRERAEKAEASLKERDLQMKSALEETESMFQRTQRAEIENVELREAKEKAEAACAEMRNALSHWFIKDDEGNYPDEAQYYTPTISPVARRILDSSTCGQPLLDRMKAMEDILSEVCHTRMPHHAGSCFEGCPACRWEALKKVKP